MVLLTKLDNTKLLLNTESVKYIESTPDTIIFFLNGDSLIVRESLAEIVDRVVELKASIIRKSKQEE